MPRWLKRTLTIVLGLFAAFVATGLIESLNMMLFPAPEGLDPHRPEDLRKLMAEMPVGAFLVVLLAWATGSFCGAFVAVRWGPERKFWPAWVIGSIQLLAGVSMLLMIPHPAWFAVIGLASFLPMAALGGSLARRGC